MLELKRFLEIADGDTSEDTKLSLLVTMASDLISESINRPDLFKKERTEYYNGTGTQQLSLRSRPVFTSPTIAVVVDEEGFWGAASGSFSGTALTYGTDFGLAIDQADGSSRSGVLVRVNNLWPRPAVRQGGYLSPFIGTGFGSVKVTYTAGWTTDSMPAVFRLALNLLVAKIRMLLPQGMELAAGAYEELSLSFAIQQKNYLMSLVKPLIFQHKNWSF